jgi:hypothetical protein
MRLLAEAPAEGQIEVKVGNRVLVTIAKEKPVREWTCGRLLPRDQVPKENLFGIEPLSRLVGPSRKASSMTHRDSVSLEW